ncbi:class I SAM-dependent methyltransferase [Allokutzneria sp. A3M-2-11 16]|uniref:class I SAM-dependent methyltransferase n=1 Tax=Allokutzneria sp. A3M-2-11 16 TaxID=2962043 RepID=UPI0020B77B51|nr:class I SAM-dependent methyltransferase [Allokutzneria sp. A3M-2-11 16]MCP3800990.1 class I SAM-dependent methyltransferase [Allokutzneria sp. A3M-2-11 16]
MNGVVISPASPLTGLFAAGSARAERRLVEHARLGPGDAVLVLGAGTGTGVRAAGALVPKGVAIAVDPSPDALRSCAARCSGLVGTGQVRLRPGTAERTGLGDGSVDVAISVDTVHLWPDVAAGFTELHRVLRPGGTLLLSVRRSRLRCKPLDLRLLARDAGFTEVIMRLGSLRLFSAPRFELLARKR